MKLTTRMFVSYIRVSTRKQGDSGLGLEAQRAAVANYLNGDDWMLVREVVEIESGKRNDRPKLTEALKVCRRHRATLIIAKLDRLARDVHFISGLMKSGVEFRVVDMPEANKLTIHIMAAMAEHEAEAISQRTKVALAAAKARGTTLGGRRQSIERFQEIASKGREAAAVVNRRKRENFQKEIRPVIDEIIADGATTLREIAAELNGRGEVTRQRGKWSATQVMRVIKNTTSQTKIEVSL